MPLRFDAARLLADVEALGLPSFVYYDAVPLRSPAHLVDPTLPAPPPAEDYADGTWTSWLDVPALASAPAIVEALDAIRALAPVNLVRVLRLAPGAVVQEHTDPTLALHIARSMVRLTIPVQCPSGASFFLNGTPVPFAPGECWYLRLSDPHRVVNDTEVARIHLTVDVVPTPELTLPIQSSAAAWCSVGSSATGRSD